MDDLAGQPTRQRFGAKEDTTVHSGPRHDLGNTARAGDDGAHLDFAFFATFFAAFLACDLIGLFGFLAMSVSSCG
jgi:hypothetical protein